jgi:hypothetical protein
MARTATCACGQLSAECQGEPSKVSLCHCLACQKRTGSTYGIAAFFAETDVATRGHSHRFSRPSDSGHDITFHFCPECGATVFWYPHRKPGTIAIAVGAFADPDFPAPSQAVFDQHRHTWIAELP